MEVVKFDSKTSWLIAIACLCMNLLVLLPTKISGLFFVEFLDRFQVSRNIAGYPIFTSTLMRCSGGPFAGYVAERFGINEVMILGAILSAMGISACFFAENIATAIVFMGLIHGIGVSFTQTFIPQIVKIHFRKHLTLAFGITQTGACIGSFSIPPLLLWIFQSYGASGGFLIIGAIVLNTLPIVLVLNILSPNEFHRKSGDSIKPEECPEEHLETGKTTAVASSGDKNMTNKVGAKEEKNAKTREENVISELQNKLEIRSVAALVLNRPTYDRAEVVPGKTDEVALNPTNDLDMGYTPIKESRKLWLELVSDEYGAVKPKNRNEMKIGTDEKISELQYDFKEQSIPVVDTRTKLMANNFEETLTHSNNSIHSKTDYKLKTQMNNEDILKYQVGDMRDCYSIKDCNNKTPSYAFVSNETYCNYLVDQENITTENREIIPTSLSVLNVNSLQSKEPSNLEFNQKELSKIGKRLTTEKTNVKKSLQIFLDLTYWIVVITASIHVIVLVIFWSTMIDFSRDKNIERSKEVYLLMALPVGEIIGRVGLGWIIDSKYLTRINFSVFSFILMGGSCSLMAWAEGFYFVIASIIIFGIISSGLITVFPMIIFEFFDSSKYTMGQASKYCLFGPLSLLNGPLIGYFRGTLGSYVWLYHTVAMVSVACAALSALIPMFAKMRDEKKKNRTRKF